MNFPTNCEGEFKADLFKKNFGEKIQSIYKKDIKFSKKKLNEKLLFKFSEEEELKLLKMGEQKFPLS